MMRFTNHRTHLLFGLLALAAIALLAAGCDVDTPQNTFDAKGEVAQKQKDIFLYAMWPAIVIMIGVLLATVIILLRFRRRSDDEIPVQTHGNTKLEIAWTIAPAMLLLGLGVPMVGILWDITSDPSDDAFQLNVEGQQFAWVFTYPELLDEDGEPLGPLVNEAIIPAGREVSVNLTSTDVIHSFWVPKLAGKLDAVPGRTNRMWIRVDEPGSYSGQCAEFCGLQHADMLMTVTALGEEDFEAWVDEMTAGGSDDSAEDSEESGE